MVLATVGVESVGARTPQPARRLRGRVRGGSPTTTPGSARPAACLTVRHRYEQPRTKEKVVLMQELTNLAMPQLGVGALGLAFLVGLTVYLNIRHKDKDS